MSLPQSPPTTSGIVVLSGSNSFDPQSSDFPAIRGLIENSDNSSVLLANGGGGVDTTNTFFLSSPVVGKITEPFKEELEVQGGVATLDGLVLFLPIAGTIKEPGEKEELDTSGVVLALDLDVDITSTAVTTSGIVIVDIFPGAGAPIVPFVPPVVFNERFFPNFQGPFPEHDSRIFPRLPQFSTLTPGD